MQNSQKVNGAYREFLLEQTPYLLELVKRAGAKTLEFYQKSDLAVELKSDSSPVTLADKEANRILCEGLNKFNLPIISEEGHLATWEERKQYSGVWILDPLDGTKAFVKGEREFTVNLAFVEKGMALYGIIYAPVLDEICWSQFDKVFWQKGDKKQELKRAPSAFISRVGFLKEDCLKEDFSTEKEKEKETQENKPRIFVSKSSSDNQATRDFLQKIGEYDLVKASSSWKFCAMAKDEADIYPRFGTTCEWDIAAGDAIISALGGQVLEASTGKKLSYNKPNLENPHFIASL